MTLAEGKLMVTFFKRLANKLFTTDIKMVCSLGSDAEYCVHAIPPPDGFYAKFNTSTIPYNVVTTYLLPYYYVF